jgi:hypothetical protein
MTRDRTKILKEDVNIFLNISEIDTSMNGFLLNMRESRMLKYKNEMERVSSSSIRRETPHE